MKLNLHQKCSPCTCTIARQSDPCWHPQGTGWGDTGPPQHRSHLYFHPPQTNREGESFDLTGIWCLDNFCSREYVRAWRCWGCCCRHRLAGRNPAHSPQRAAATPPPSRGNPPRICWHWRSTDSQSTTCKRKCGTEVQTIRVQPAGEMWYWSTDNQYYLETLGGLERVILILLFRNFYYLKTLDGLERVILLLPSWLPSW